MKGTEINLGLGLKSSMCKVKVHHRRRYVFSGLITLLCRNAAMPEEALDYIVPFCTVAVDVTKTKGPGTNHGPTLTTAECHQRDDLICNDPPSYFLVSSFVSSFRAFL